MFSKQTLFRSSIRAAFSNQVLRTSGRRSDPTLNPLICASKNSNQSQIFNILPRNILARFMSDSNKSLPSPLDFIRSAGPKELESEKTNQSMNLFSEKPNQSMNLFSEKINQSNNFMGERTNQSLNFMGNKTNQSTNFMGDKTNQSTNFMGDKTNESMNSMGESNNGSMNFMGESNNGSMNYVSRMLNENRRDFYYGGHGFQKAVEHNADIVHIKIYRNNTFVTLTDSMGNKKAGASSGVLSEMKGGPKNSRYTSEGTAEHIGRVARSMGMKSVVIKVNGFTKFNKKKSSILAFRDGYTHSRGDSNPIVYLEDTTRKAHNGCRLRKKKRK